MTGFKTINKASGASNLENPIKRIEYQFFLLALFTCSFDIFLTLSVHGFNFRASQILMWVPTVIALSMILNSKGPSLPLGFWWLCWWVFFIIIWIPNSSFPLRNVGYGVWLLLDVLIVWVTVQLFSTPELGRTLVRWYLTSFAFVACFAIFQFVAGTLGGEGILVTQWIVPGQIPRVNGFSYEPSYFATYMLLGWISSGYLWMSRCSFFSPRLTSIVFSLCTVALLLSTSRLGWLIMALWVLIVARPLINRILQLVRETPLGFLFAFNSGIVALLAIVWVFASGTANDVALKMLGGTGLVGTPSHSFTNRLDGLVNTLEIVADHPFIGVSLGGVATAIADAQGVIVAGNEGAKEFEGMSVFAEVLAASGLVGFIPFLMYFTTLIVNPWNLSYRIDKESGKFLRALIIALLFELVILQFNQNILRVYLWFHIGVLSAVYGGIVKTRINLSSVAEPVHIEKTSP